MKNLWLIISLTLAFVLAPQLIAAPVYEVEIELSNKKKIKRDTDPKGQKQPGIARP